MKNILIICVLVLFTPCDLPAQSDPNPAKTRALELRGALDSISKTSDSSQASWDATRTAIDNYQKEFGVSAATTNNIVLLRKFELSVARKFPDPARFLTAKNGTTRSAGTLGSVRSQPCGLLIKRGSWPPPMAVRTLLDKWRNY